jgi:hypothetical protein
MPSVVGIINREPSLWLIRIRQGVAEMWESGLGEISELRGTDPEVTDV